MRIRVTLILVFTMTASLQAGTSSSPFGTRLKLDLRTGQQYSGELLVAQSDSLWLLSDTRELSVIHLGNVTCARVPRGGLSAPKVMIWSLIGGLVSGALLTAACSSVEGNDCGGVLAVTLVMWAGFGGINAAAAGSSWRQVDIEMETLMPYARYPQGKPPGFEADVLKGPRPAAPGADSKDQSEDSLETTRPPR
jgi:hypothetical protein